MKYYVIAGEASGDLHGSNLIRELKKLDEKAIFRGWGGDLMQQAGTDLVKHYRDLAFMGFVEVLKNLRTILGNLRFCKEDIASFKPDAVILIDYPGFNIPIAQWAKKQGIKVIYYISPQVWAWKERRVKTLRESVDKMLVILPFEPEFYKKWNFSVLYVGHPLIQVIEEFKEEHQQISNPALEASKSIIAILPGSRKQEVAKKLPVMLSVSQYFPDYQFIIAKAQSLDDSFYETFTAAYPNVSTVKNQTYELLMKAKAAMVTSGTATLETALFGVPEVVCYKGNAISYQIAKRVVSVPFISLVNLIMNKLVVKELIQYDLTVDNLKKELDLLLYDGEKEKQLREDYTQLRNLLGQGGYASANAAQIIWQFVSSNAS